jgi:hypothetical protein
METEEQQKLNKDLLNTTYNLLVLLGARKYFAGQIRTWQWQAPDRQTLDELARYSGELGQELKADIIEKKDRLTYYR